MKIFRSSSSPVQPADVRTFTGDAQVSRLASDEAGVPVHVYRVEFKPGARTNWHTHSGPQWLFILEGRVRVQTWGEQSFDVAAGDAVVIVQGEKHWHGAAPELAGIHLAINVGATTNWLEPVLDEQYGGRASA
jgi:quercetin dioxygenase-like cupin family protein